MTQHEVEDVEVDVEDIDAGLDEDLTDPELDPEELDVEEPEPPASTAGVTPQDHALAGLDPDLRAETMRRAAAYGVVHADDPVWVLVRAVVESHAASQAAGVAAETTQQAVARLDEAPALIERAALDGAARAAGEIQEHARQGAEAVAESLAGAIERAAAGPVARVLSPHVKALSDQAGDIRKVLLQCEAERIEASAEQFLQRVAQHINSHSTATKTSGRLSAVLLLAIGAAIGVAGVKLDHRWSPVPIHSAPGGGFTLRIPAGDAAQFGHCGSHACAYIHANKPRRGSKT